MVSQLQRSKARKQLTKLCSNSIIQIISQITNDESSEKLMYDSYLLALKITLGVAVEGITGKEIPNQLSKPNKMLSFFNGSIDQISHYKSTLPSLNIVKSFIENNLNDIAEEDLGGVSELFTGHQAVWDNDQIKLIHNPNRRDAGKIYTPYDVTRYMSNGVAKSLISRCETVEQLYKMKVLEPAVGSGAFCSQLVRVMWKKAKRKWNLQDESEFREKVCSKVIHACDIDAEALKLARVVMWITAGCPEKGLELNFSLCDSLAAGPCENKTDWKNHTMLEINRGYDAIIGNPPYVRVKPEIISIFETNSVKNLYSAFTELGLNLLNGNGTLCLIIPQSIIGSKESLPLREIILNQDAKVTFQIFDSVPDFLFDQGKIESNTNTNINQRTAIITVDRNSKKSIHTSPLLRWRRTAERDSLFNSLKSIRISMDDIYNGAIPMLENSDNLRLFRKLREQKTTIADVVVKEGGKLLYIPKAIRYFITGIPIDLERPNTILLRVNSEFYELIHSTINSNLFYWWWRVNGNGFQVEMKNVLSFPLLPLKKEKAVDFSNQLDDCLDQCRVFKHNAGKQIPNINYNFKQNLLQSIDSALLNSIQMTPHERVFGCKTNSLNGNMNGLRGYMSDTSSDN